MRAFLLSEFMSKEDQKISQSMINFQFIHINQLLLSHQSTMDGGYHWLKKLLQRYMSIMKWSVPELNLKQLDFWQEVQLKSLFQMINLPKSYGQTWWMPLKTNIWLQLLHLTNGMDLLLDMDILLKVILWLKDKMDKKSVFLKSETHGNQLVIHLSKALAMVIGLENTAPINHFCPKLRIN